MRAREDALTAALADELAAGDAERKEVCIFASAQRRGLSRREVRGRKANYFCIARAAADTQRMRLSV